MGNVVWIIVVCFGFLIIFVIMWLEVGIRFNKWLVLKSLEFIF